MKISGINLFAHRLSFRAQNSNTADEKAGIFVKPLVVTNKQADTIDRSIAELKAAVFDVNDAIYMKNLGVNLPFKSGAEVAEFLQNKNIDVKYANFSNPKVHACLDYGKNSTSILINSNYKDLASHADILAISEAISHEAGHAKDDDTDNSIQEEMDCLALNVMVHQYYKKKYPGIFDKQDAFLYKEGINLYSKLFFEFDTEKNGLKKRINEKYGYLKTGCSKHPASTFAEEIKNGGIIV